jgi:hypothetical protein
MGDRLVSAIDYNLKSELAVQRLEVITVTGRRRRISRDDKARMVEETLAEGAVVSEVAVGTDLRHSETGLPSTPEPLHRASSHHARCVPVTVDRNSALIAQLTDGRTRPTISVPGKQTSSVQSRGNGCVWHLTDQHLYQIDDINVGGPPRRPALFFATSRRV